MVAGRTWELQITNQLRNEQTEIKLLQNSQDSLASCCCSSKILCCASYFELSSGSSDKTPSLVFDRYGLLTKCEVKMAGYWPSYFFASLWTETKSRSINSQKKNEANIQPS